jgi:hypothetical protein
VTVTSTTLDANLGRGGIAGAAVTVTNSTVTGSYYGIFGASMMTIPSAPTDPGLPSGDLASIDAFFGVAPRDEVFWPFA